MATIGKIREGGETYYLTDREAVYTVDDDGKRRYHQYRNLPPGVVARIMSNDYEVA